MSTCPRCEEAKAKWGGQQPGGTRKQYPAKYTGTRPKVFETPVTRQQPQKMPIPNVPTAPERRVEEQEGVTPDGNEMVRQAMDLAKAFEGLPKELLEAAMTQWLEERRRAHQEKDPPKEEK